VSDVGEDGRGSRFCASTGAKARAGDSCHGVVSQERLYCDAGGYVGCWLTSRSAMEVIQELTTGRVATQKTEGGLQCCFSGGTDTDPGRWEPGTTFSIIASPAASRH